MRIIMIEATAEELRMSRSLSDTIVGIMGSVFNNLYPEDGVSGAEEKEETSGQ